MREFNPSKALSVDQPSFAMVSGHYASQSGDPRRVIPCRSNHKVRTNEGIRREKICNANSPGG